MGSFDRPLEPSVKYMEETVIADCSSREECFVPVRLALLGELDYEVSSWLCFVLAVYLYIGSCCYAVLCWAV